jgi:hypothetical protein
MIELAHILFGNLLQVIVQFFVNVLPGYMVFVLAVFVSLLPYSLYLLFKEATKQ